MAKPSLGGLYPPFPQHSFLREDQVRPFPTLPCPVFQPGSSLLLAGISDGQDILEDPSHVPWLQPSDII